MQILQHNYFITQRWIRIQNTILEKVAVVHPTMQQPWNQKIGGSGSEVFIIIVWSADYLYLGGCYTYSCTVKPPALKCTPLIIFWLYYIFKSAISANDYQVSQPKYWISRYNLHMHNNMLFRVTIIYKSSAAFYSW